VFRATKSSPKRGGRRGGGAFSGYLSKVAYGTYCRVFSGLIKPFFVSSETLRGCSFSGFIRRGWCAPYPTLFVYGTYHQRGNAVSVAHPFVDFVRILAAADFDNAPKKGHLNHTEIEVGVGAGAFPNH